MRGRQDSARQRSGRNPVLLCWLVIAAAAMVLAGCGNLSLTNVLSNESPGEFRLSPETVNLRVGGQFTFSATGGFTPYNYQVVSGLGTLKEQTWVYQAPTDPITDPPYYIEEIIQATDQLGDSDTATVRVFNPFDIDGRKLRIVQLPLEDPITIEATGGVPDEYDGYSWSVDGTVVDTGTKSYDYSPNTTGIHVVSVTDSIGNYLEVTVIVLPELNAPLTIYPNSVGVEVGDTVIFEAYGGTAPYYWAPEANFDSTNGTPVTYTATAVGTDTVTLTDSTDAKVTASVTVTAASIPTLVLSPENPTVAAVGDQVQFRASGGVGPYNFTAAPSPHGSIDRVTGLYTQKTAGKDVKVTVTDAVGSTDQTFVRWVSP